MYSVLSDHFIVVYGSVGPFQNPYICIVNEDGAHCYLWLVFYRTVAEGVYNGPTDIGSVAPMFSISK